jgi:hypothetical protein
VLAVAKGFPFVAYFRPRLLETLFSTSPSRRPNASASRRQITRVGERCPFSIFPIVVRSTPDSAPNCFRDKPRRSRSARSVSIAQDSIRWASL